MDKFCLVCGKDLRCLKTGLVFTFKGQQRVGDLFGCDVCGNLDVFGIPDTKGPFPEIGLNAEVFCGTLFGPQEDYPYSVIRNVWMSASPRFLVFLENWSKGFLEKHMERFVPLEEGEK